MQNRNNANVINVAGKKTILVMDKTNNTKKAIPTTRETINSIFSINL